ncbi:MAG: LysR family transcriptional regulator [Microbacteriaceae bacterium]|nr:LysR family transcriptional regulator [Microbacteriaceae bacterium]
MAVGDRDLNLLVALRALLEEANVTRAGERIGMGQSTMSSALARLRTQFQDELLVRVGRDYELTPLARQLLPQVQVTLPLIERALGQLRGFDPTLTRTFTVQLTDYAAIELRPLFVLASAAAEGVQLELHRLAPDPAGSEHELLSLDFMVAPPGINVEGESFELFRDDYIVAADAGNPAVAGGEISLEDFVSLPHARCDFGRGQLTAADRRMHELDLSFDVRVTTSTLLTIPPVIAGTDLVAVVPRRLIDHVGAISGVVAVPTPFPAVELIERLWWHPAHSPDPGHHWMRELFAEAVRAGALAA